MNMLSINMYASEKKNKERKRKTLSHIKKILFHSI